MHQTNFMCDMENGIATAAQVVNRWMHFWAACRSLQGQVEVLTGSTRLNKEVMQITPIPKTPNGLVGTAQQR